MLCTCISEKIDSQWWQCHDLLLNKCKLVPDYLPKEQILHIFFMWALAYKNLLKIYFVWCINTESSIQTSKFLPVASSLLCESIKSPGIW